jgi:hypothetical protein
MCRSLQRDGVKKAARVGRFFVGAPERNVSALNAFAERFSRGPASQVLHE